MIDPGTNLSYRTLDHPETGSGELVEETRATVDPAARMKKLAVAGRLIMEGMPFIPLVKESKDFMLKPYVKDLPLNVPMNLRFKYAWVETK